MGDRTGAAVDRDRRTESHDRDARWHPYPCRYLPSARRVPTLPGDLGAHAVQLQFLGCSERCAARHVLGVALGATRVRPHRHAGARSLLRGGELGHPRPTAHRRGGRARLDHEPAVVERKGGNDGVLVDCRVAARGGLPGAHRICRDERPGVRCRCGPRRSLLRGW